MYMEVRMRNVQRGLVLLVLTVALLLMAMPVAADGGGKNVVFGQDYTLKSGEVLNDNLVVFGGKVHLERDSRVRGDLTVMGGDATIEGTVDGDIVAFGGSVALTENAVAGRDLVVFAGQVHRDPNAKVMGNVVEGLQASKRLKDLPSTLENRTPVAPRPVTPISGAHPSGAGFFGNIATLVALLIIAALVVSIVPEHLDRTINVMLRNPGLCFVMGALTLVVAALLMVVAALLSIICIGIPILLVLVIALAAAALLGVIAAGRWVGKLVLDSTHSASRTPLKETLLGTLVLGVVGMVPCIGWAAMLGATCWGVGGAVLTRLGTQTYPPTAPFVTPPATPTSGNAPTSAPAPAAPPRRPGDTHPLDPSVLDEDRPR
jgi:hypothetical protein